MKVKYDENLEMLIMESKNLKIARILQSLLVGALAINIFFTVTSIHLLEGVGRTINYAGLVRGATQRLIKLEIIGESNQQLEDKLDTMINDLRTNGHVYNLVSISDVDFQNCLTVQMEYWELLKKEIEVVRSQGYQSSDIISLSETYFDLSDKTVDALEDYSENLVSRCEVFENGMIINVVVLILVSLYSSMIYRKLAKVKENEIRKQAEHDALTGLLNRRSFDKLSECCEKNGSPYLLHIIDVDNFKQFNDNYGHSTGDEVLKKVANSLKSTYRSTDYICRIGGDEFAVLMVDMPLNMKTVAVNKLEHLRDVLRDTSDGVPTITLSIGAAFSESLPSGSKLFDAADEALYKVKENGKNNYGFYKLDK